MYHETLSPQLSLELAAWWREAFEALNELEDGSAPRLRSATPTGAPSL
jgi:hypothetical protein